MAGSNPQYLAEGDFNGDGKTDVAVTVGTGVVILAGNGDGTFQAPGSSIITLANSATSLAAGDFNGAGKTDLAVASVNGPLFFRISSTFC